MSKPRPGGRAAADSSATAPPAWAIVDASFLAAAHDPSALPPPLGAELAFAGRSNVGKSSLMNALLGRRRLVRTSSTPGCTRALAFFEARARDGAVLHLVDLPGYGYAKRSKAERAIWARLVEGYLESRDHLRAVVVLIDGRHGPTADDRRLLEFVSERPRSHPEIIVVATKLDKVPKSRRRAALRQHAAALARPVLGASATQREGLSAIWSALRRAALGETPA